MRPSVIFKKLIHACPFVVVAVLFSAVFLAKLSGIMINLTPSIKEGLYVKRQGTIRRGEIVAVCLDEPYKTIGLRRLYIGEGKACKGAYPLLKQVLAVPGDNVMLSDRFIQVNNKKYLYKTLYVDSIGRALNVYPRGAYLNTTGYWLVGNHDLKSWDSRYWGPVKKTQILSALKPIFTWQ